MVVEADKGYNIRVIGNPAAPAGTRQFACDFPRVQFGDVRPDDPPGPSHRRDRNCASRIETVHRTKKQVALLKTFADQAVIAIENVRLFNETKEALEQQKASADILRVISNSVADTQPVFDKILESCKHLFGGDELDVLLVDEQGLLQVAAYVGNARDAVMATFPAPVDITPAGRAIRERRVAHYVDVINNPDTPPVLRRMGRVAGYHSVAFAPMVWEDRGIGVVGVARSRGAFTDKELALLQTFADQAVIAIQNSRLFNETQEALQQQTATADILGVMSTSPTDVRPVFEAIAERARVLCKAHLGMTTRLDGELLHLVGVHGISGQAEATLRGAFPMTLELAPPNARRAILERTPIQIPDVLLEPGYRHVEGAQQAGFRSILSVPLLHEGRAIGTIGVAREEPGAFPEKVVALLQTFARQAVIAIENVRLFNETKEALERQTATANVLKAISRSTFDLAAVLETLISTAARLCRAWMGVIFRIDGDVCRPAGLFGATPALIAHLEAHPISLRDQDSVTSRAVAAGHAVQVEDTTDRQKYGRGDVQQVGGYRTLLAVPILREGVAIGVLTLGRAEVQAYNEKEIELVTSFADQAAIAMENVRLFNETKEALEQQTATAEVLKVISSSVADTAPVFDKILESCERLFQGSELGILLIDEERQLLSSAAFRGERRRMRSGCSRWPCRRIAATRSPGDSRQPGLALHRCAAGRRHAQEHPQCRQDAGDRQLLAGLRADAVGRARHRRALRDSQAAVALHRQGSDAAQDLRRPGGDRDPERAAVQRDSRPWSGRPAPPRS